MSISIQQISYIHPDKEVLFSDLNFAISKGQKLGLVGNNGCGKSTLLQIIAGQLSPSSGVIVRPDDLYYIPQHFGQYDSLTIAQALQIERKQQALHAILAGDVSNENFTILNDDWNIVSRSVAKGESHQVFLAKISGNNKCAGHSECDAIIMENAHVDATPELSANNIDASLIHEAAIGKIAGDQLIKLMTLGLTEAEAEEQIINGFLK